MSVILPVSGSLLIKTAVREEGECPFMQLRSLVGEEICSHPLRVSSNHMMIRRIFIINLSPSNRY